MTTLKSLFTGESLRQLMKVGLVGVANTIATFAIFNLCRSVIGMSRTVSVAVAFALATLMSYVLNRRWSFALTDGGENLHETAKFFGINVIAWAATEGMMRLAEAWFGPLSKIGENVALIVASGIILVPKFLGYRDGVFGNAMADQERSTVA